MQLQMYLSMTVHIYNLSTRETETGVLQVQGQSGLHSKTPSQKTKTKSIITNIDIMQRNRKRVLITLMWQVVSFVFLS
jgi:hypothetical protein